MGKKVKLIRKIRIVIIPFLNQLSRINLKKNTISLLKLHQNNKIPNNKNKMLLRNKNKINNRLTIMKVRYKKITNKYKNKMMMNNKSEKKKYYI